MRRRRRRLRRLIRCTSLMRLSSLISLGRSLLPPLKKPSGGSNSPDITHLLVRISLQNKKYNNLSLAAVYKILFLYAFLNFSAFFFKLNLKNNIAIEEEEAKESPLSKDCIFSEVSSSNGKMMRGMYE